jgi:hypothetical protein
MISRVLGTLQSRTGLRNGFGKGTASAVPPRANKTYGLQPLREMPFPCGNIYETSSHLVSSLPHIRMCRASVQ